MERPLCLDRRRLFTGHAGGEQQRPHAIVAGKWANSAFDAGDQTQALAGETEASRHGVDPRWNLFQPSAQRLFPSHERKILVVRIEEN
ncbi:hypothetical protein D3C81_1967770 [compost metagenome]